MKYYAPPENIHTPLHRRDWNYLGGGGFCKAQKFKEMCEALSEFPEGWGVLEKIPSMEELWIILYLLITCPVRKSTCPGRHFF